MPAPAPYRALVHRLRAHRGGGVDDVLDTGFGDHACRNVLQAEPPAARRHLLQRLLAGGVQHRTTRVQGGCGLQHQCRLADARIAAQQRHGTGDETAAEHAVEFRGPGRQPGLLGDRLGRQCRGSVGTGGITPPPAGLACSGAARPGPGRRRLAGTGAQQLRAEGVPIAADGALALPFGRSRAAVLADEHLFGLAHPLPSR